MTFCSVTHHLPGIGPLNHGIQILLMLFLLGGTIDGSVEKTAIGEVLERGNLLPISLTKSKNNSGPRTVSCGMPRRTCKTKGTEPPRTYLC